jgi:hypothetical protein
MAPGNTGQAAAFCASSLGGIAMKIFFGGKCMKKSCIGLMVVFALMVISGYRAEAQSAKGEVVECLNSDPASGTAVTLTIGRLVIPAVLNDTVTARDLISRLPYTVRLHKYTQDFCGVMPNPLRYDPKDIQNGWRNGDIHFATDGNYFVLFFADEDISQRYGYQIHIGKMNVDAEVLRNLNDRDIDVRIELAK